MRCPLVPGKCLAGFGLCFGLWLATTGRTSAQDGRLVGEPGAALSWATYVQPSQEGEPGPYGADVPPEGGPDGMSSGGAYGGDGENKGDGKSKNPWAKVPPVRPMPPPGWFIVPPKGWGYYSLLDLLEDVPRKEYPKIGYPPTSICAFPFFDADFSFLDDPKYKDRDCFDSLKRIHPTCDWMLTFGGEERARYMSEVSYARITNKYDDYTLIRSRVFMDLWYRDIFRFYVEMLDARSTTRDVGPLPIDVDHGDLLNLFVDVKLAEIEDKPVYVRAGRQELLFGSQRLISPLDWANTLRTFEGVQVFRQGEKFDASAFWVQPVKVDPNRFDSVDNLQNFYGTWFTYRPKKGQYFDLYYLDLNNANPTFTGPGGAKGGYDVNTVGSRWAGEASHVLWDFEGMYQWGEWPNATISAAAYTVSGGYQFADLPLNPQVWVAYDYASGDDNGGTSGMHGTFNQLFPFGHYYFGYLDLVGRQNIRDLNGQIAFYPAKWILCNMQFHHFELDSARDALYSSGGAVVKVDPTGNSGRDVGDEFDFYTNFHLDRHSDVLVGYSYLNPGGFLRNTGTTRSPEFFYVQYSFRW